MKSLFLIILLFLVSSCDRKSTPMEYINKLPRPVTLEQAYMYPYHHQRSYGYIRCGSNDLHLIEGETAYLIFNGKKSGHVLIGNIGN